MSDVEARELIEDFLTDFWPANPVKATYSGVREYDGKLPDVSIEARKEWLSKRKEALRKVEDALGGGSGFSQDAKLDLDFLRRTLESGIILEKATRPVERNPCVGPESALYGLYFLTLRPFESESSRAERMTERLRGIPALLEEASRQITTPADVPALWVTIARQSVQGGSAFIGSALDNLAGLSPSTQGEFERAAGEAQEALEGYGRFLDTLSEEAGGDYALGEELFDMVCLDFHGLDFKAEDLIEVGKEAIEETIGALREQARRIDPQATWQEVVERLNTETVEPSQVLHLYKEQMEKARAFVEEKGLATIPSGERLEIVPTPTFARFIIPYAAYIPPGPFEDEQTGYFWVTPVEESDPEARAHRLRGHVPTKAQVTALHEAYPGHHLQFARANGLSWPVRKVFTSTVLVEGWALYCEELMYEEGFYTEPAVRFMQLIGQLWRACRVVIDASLHTRRMTPAEAVEMLVEVAKLSRTNAEAEVRRYTLSPTQPMSYHMGKRELLELRSAYRQLKGARFSLKEFHDRFLEFGGLPLPTIRDCMLEEVRAEAS
jgi:uncharacterized protein (DUF885 family)